MFGPRLAPVLTACLLAACTVGIGGDLPDVDGPLPRLDPAPVESPTGTVARLPGAWLFYTRPPEMYGTPVLWAAAGKEWEVTGRWTAEPGVLEGHQYWVLMGGVFTWYRLTADIVPWGRVHLWGQLPDDWVHGDRTAVPTVEPSWGEPWETVPYSRGHVLIVPADEQPALQVCPDPACPVLERPVRGQAVPVTGRFMNDSGQLWYRVEFRQRILWVGADAGRLAVSWEAYLPRGDAEAAGYRSCEPLVLYPPPPHTLCAVNGEGRFLDLLERERDRLDPVFGRLPRQGERVESTR